MHLGQRSQPPWTNPQRLCQRTRVPNRARVTLPHHRSLTWAWAKESRGGPGPSNGMGSSPLALLGCGIPGHVELVQQRRQVLGDCACLGVSRSG